MIRFACPTCQKALQAPEDKAGVKVACPGCRTPLEVPSPGTPAADMILSPPPGSWVYLRDGQRHGPVSWEQLCRLAADGTIQPTDGVLTHGMTEPVPAESIPGLYPEAAAVAPEPQPIDVPLAGARPPSSRSASRRPWWEGALAEGRAIVTTTAQQSVRPVSYLLALRRYNQLRQRAEEARLLLGQRMYETEVGDEPLRSQIRSLGERIHSIEAVKGVTKDVVAERRALVLQLGDSGLQQETAPSAIEPEHRRARAVHAEAKAQEGQLRHLRAGLLPADRATWRRVGIGYAVAVGLLLTVGGMIWLLGSSGRAARERDRQLLAEQQRIEQQRADEDRQWQTEKKTEEIVALCGPSVALIRCEQGGGTGFMILPGVVATNAHVINSDFIDQVKVYFPSAKEGSQSASSARLLYFDARRDLAFLAVPPRVPPLRLADRFEFKSGHAITVIGCPDLGAKQAENAVRVGVLSTKHEIGKQPYYEMGIAVNPGNSGGPVFDSRGQVIGVVTLKSGREQTAFCIPWQDLGKAIANLEQQDLKQGVAQANSLHTLNVVMDRVFHLGLIYSAAMEFYEQRLRTAREERIPFKEALTQAQREFGEGFKQREDRLLTLRLRATALNLRSDPHLTTEIRSRFGALWDTCQEMKGHALNPRDDLTAYSRKSSELRKRFQRDLDTLAVALGFDLPDDN